MAYGIVAFVRLIFFPRLLREVFELLFFVLPVSIGVSVIPFPPRPFDVETEGYSWLSWSCTNFRVGNGPLFACDSEWVCTKAKIAVIIIMQIEVKIRAHGSCTVGYLWSLRYLLEGVEVRVTLRRTLNICNNRKTEKCEEKNFLSSFRSSTSHKHQHFNYLR